MTTSTEKRTMIRELLNAQNGKIFTVNFVGKTGATHTLNGRLGVCKYSHGGRNNAVGHDDILTAFNMSKLAYRNVYLDGVTSLTVAGKKFSF